MKLSREEKRAIKQYKNYEKSDKKAIKKLSKQFWR